MLGVIVKEPLLGIVPVIFALSTYAVFPTKISEAIASASEVSIPASVRIPVTPNIVIPSFIFPALILESIAEVTAIIVPPEVYPEGIV